MIYRGPGFLASFNWLLAPPPPPPGEVGGRWAKSCDHKKAWSSINHSTLSAINPLVAQISGTSIHAFCTVVAACFASSDLITSGGYGSQCTKHQNMYSRKHNCGTSLTSSAFMCLERRYILDERSYMRIFFRINLRLFIPPPPPPPLLLRI